MPFVGHKEQKLGGEEQEGTDGLGGRGAGMLINVCMSSKLCAAGRIDFKS